MSLPAGVVLGVGLGAVLLLVVDVAAAIWYERVWLPRIAGDE